MKHSISKYNNYSSNAGKLIYLAVPYTARNPDLQTHRNNEVTSLSARLVQHGIYNLSPITQSHQQQLMGDLPHTWDFWEECDTLFLERCDELWVYLLAGWKKSVGVRAEIELATAMQKPIKYLSVTRHMSVLCPGIINVYDDPSEYENCPD